MKRCASQSTTPLYEMLYVYMNFVNFCDGPLINTFYSYFLRTTAPSAQLNFTLIKLKVCHGDMIGKISKIVLPCPSSTSAATINRQLDRSLILLLPSRDQVDISMYQNSTNVLINNVYL